MSLADVYDLLRNDDIEHEVKRGRNFASIEFISFVDFDQFLNLCQKSDIF